ncbi:MAG TPA: LysM peptidoglycan-binding domain-containing protein [Chloroflexi bacterium]|nr:LysM peptidoglycan-binding domain-containing protein [Chloroflexota bacterium]
MYKRIVLTLMLLLAFVAVQAHPVHAQSSDPPHESTVHVVQRGETLFAIAERYGMTANAITHANGIPDPRQIYVGQRLVIPGNREDISAMETTPYVVQAGDTLASIARRYHTTWQTLLQINALLTPNVIYAGQVIQAPLPTLTDTGATRSLPSDGATYVVHPDDTLLRIALRHTVSPWQLMTANHLTNPALIHAGQEIVIPGKDGGLLPEPFNLVEVQPLPITQGSVLVIAVRTTEAVELTGSLLDQTVRFGEEDGVYYALTGIHVFTQPGIYDLHLTAVDGHGRETSISTGIVVEEGRFHYERIDVPANRNNLLAPEAIAYDRVRLDAARNTFSTERHWTIPFHRPCVGSISAYFGARRSYNGGPYTSYHSGVDYRAPGGTPVHAAAGGVVVLAEHLALWGKAVVVDHGWGVLTGYAHLSEIDVEVGQQVSRGEIIAKVGNTGLSTGSHLHWETWVGGTSVNGLQWLEEFSLPWPEPGWKALGG